MFQYLDRMNPVSTLIFVPAYNASGTIAELLERLRDVASECDILVVDDGSTDNTAELTEMAGVRVISHEFNRGKGAAIRTGLKYASENGYDGLLTIDADLQHDPDCIPKFLDLALSGDYDMIVGARERTSRMPLPRAFSNFVTSTIISLLAGVCLRDTQSGYRWMRVHAVMNLGLTGLRYDFESEMLLKAGRCGLRIGEIRIPTIYDDSTSFINPFRDTWRFMRILVRSFFW